MAVRGLAKTPIIVLVSTAPAALALLTRRCLYPGDTIAGIGPRRRAPRAHAREAKGADAPARRLRAALMSHHQGSMV